MPIFDKPLPELFQYQGTNPRPHDFDAYWAAALKELDATDPRPELQPSKVITPESTPTQDKDKGKTDDKVAPMEPGSKTDFQFNQALSLLKGLQILQKK